MRELLLGYLLGALNKTEQASVEERVKRDPQFREELKCLAISFRPAQVERGMFPAPEGLARQTIELVTKHIDQEKTNAARRRKSTRRLGRAPRHRWSLPEVVMAGGVAVAAALLFFPTIANSRFQSGMTGVQNHKRMLYLPVTNDDNASHGYLSQPAVQRHLSFAGVDAPIHQQDPGWFLHPWSSSAESLNVFKLSTAEQSQASSGPVLTCMQKNLADGYGYTLGYNLIDRYQAIRQQDRPHFDIISAAASTSAQGRHSTKPGDWGQNVLLDDGYLQSYRNPSDTVFLREHQVVERVRAAAQ